MTLVASLAVLLPLGAVAVIVGIRAPITVLAVYAAFVPFGAAVPLGLPLPAPFNSASSLVGLFTLASIVAHVTAARVRARRLPLPAPLWLMLVGFSGATVAWSIDPAATVDDFLVLVSLGLLYFAAAFLHIDEHGLSRLEMGILAGGAIAGGYALLLLLSGNLPVSGAGIPRFAAGGGGEIGDPNSTAAALLLPFVVGVHRMLAPDHAHRLRLAVAAVLSLVGIVLTLSRGGFVAVICAMVVLAVVHRRRVLLGAAVVVPLLIVGLALLTLPGAFVQRLQQTNTTGRSEIWSVGLEACPDHCLSGSGLGTFPAVHESIVLADPRHSTNRLRFEAHSLWLGTVVELGVTGLVLLLSAFAAHVWDLRSLPAQRRAAPLAALAGLVVTNTFLANLEFKYFWLVLVYATLSTTASRDLWRVPAPARELALAQR